MMILLTRASNNLTNFNGQVKAFNCGIELYELKLRELEAAMADHAQEMTKGRWQVKSLKLEGDLEAQLTAVQVAHRTLR
ncbi:hypothetical protein DD237_005161 [Peronospora effusa]|uniref:Uncharacterized protein n=1 Tax=Peronospora effusa TaxID=542832 RepID=A0A425CDH6_9STRA|nr:hypothetical protein DD237_005161 [Peronospora effusa]